MPSEWIRICVLLLFAVPAAANTGAVPQIKSATVHQEGAPPDRPDRRDAIHLRRGGVIRGHLESLDDVAVVRAVKPAGEGFETLQAQRISRAVIRRILLDGKPAPAAALDLPPLEDAALLDNGMILTGRVTVEDEFLTAGSHLPVPVDSVMLIHLHDLPTVGQDGAETDGLPLDRLEECVAALKARHAELAAFFQRQAATIEQAQVDVPGANLSARTFAEGNWVKQVEFFLSQARMTREDYKVKLRTQGMASQFSEEVYQQARHHFVQLGHVQCVGAYYQFTFELLKSALRQGMEVLFWAEALRLPLARFSQEMRTGRVVLGHSEPTRSVQEPPDDLARFGKSRSKLTHAIDMTFDAIRLSADAARRNALVEAYKIGADAVDTADKREKARWCQTVTAPSRDWASAVAARLNLAGERFQPLGSGEVKWALAEVLRYRDFAQRYVNRMLPQASGPNGPAESALSQLRWESDMDRLIQVFGHRHTSLSNIRLFLEDEKERFRAHRTYGIRRIENIAQNIAENCATAPMVPPDMHPLHTDALEKILNRAHKGLKTNLDAELEDLPVCEVSLVQTDNIYRAIGAACVQQ